MSPSEGPPAQGAAAEGADGARWLTPEERRAWVGLVAVMTVLPSTVEAPLRRDHSLMLFEYHALAMLSETPDHALPLTALSRLTNGSLSRLSHVLDRLEGRGFLTRRQSKLDRRVTEAILSPAGLAAIQAAAPDHVETVRQLVFDHLSAAQVSQLGDITGHLLTALGIDPIAVETEPPCG